MVPLGVVCLGSEKRAGGGWTGKERRLPEIRTNIRRANRGDRPIKPFKTLALSLVLSLSSGFASASDPIPPQAARAAPPAATACAPGTVQEKPLAKELASSGIMYNLAEHPKSIRAVAGRQLKDALEKRGQAASGEACKECASTRVVYRVGPTVFLPRESQLAVCLTLDQETRERPFTFADKRFKNLNQLNDWVMQFSQGRGVEGKELYERCSANCSPRYEFLLAPDADGIAVSTRVACGLARDRNNEDYEVSTALRTECGAGAGKAAPTGTP